MLKGLPWLLLLLVAPAPAWAQASLPTDPASFPFAYFSLQRAFYESNDGKSAQAKLSSLEAEQAKAIETRTATLKALQNALAQAGALLTDTARRQRELEIERFQIDLQRFVEDAQAEFLGVRREIENAFLAIVHPALAAVAEERGLLLVLNEDAGVVAWADPRLDITAAVVSRIDQP